MPRRLNLTALLVDKYDIKLSFFVGKLGFELREDTAPGTANVGSWSRHTARQAAFCSRELSGIPNIHVKVVKS